VEDFSGVLDFGVADGNLAQGAVDVAGFDVGGAGTSGGEPGGLGEEVEGSRVAFAGFGEEIDGGRGEDLAVESGAGEVPVEVGSDIVFEIMENRMKRASPPIRRESRKLRSTIPTNGIIAYPTLRFSFSDRISRDCTEAEPQKWHLSDLGLREPRGSGTVGRAMRFQRKTN